jgi:hypothetical protein
MIAPGAEEIIKERMRGLRPADTVVVSLVGPFAVLNHSVLPETGRQYDWRWVKGLDIALLIASSQDWKRTAFEIKQAAPGYLCVWDIHTHRGAEVIWRPYQTRQEPFSVELRGWFFGLDYSAFHEEDNKVFWQ